MARSHQIQCKHCALSIADNGSGWTHTEGDQQGKHRCALPTYGYDAAPPEEPCSPMCRGYRAPGAPVRVFDPKIEMA